MKTLRLIDGGYTDNTGLGTVIALAPQWEAQVRKHNDAVLTEGSGDLVLPMVVYIENGTGDDYDVSAHAESEQPENADSGAAQPPAPSSNTSGTIGWSGDLWPRKLHIPEPLVVPVGLITATDHKVSAPLALSEAQRAIRRSLCTPAVAGCNELVKAGQVAHPVIVIHQSVQPSIAAPLGWVLSDASRADLLADLSEQKQKGRVDLVSDPASQKGYGSLRDLLTALGS